MSSQVTKRSRAVTTWIPLEDREAWRAALHGVPHGFTHTWEHCHAMHLTFGAPTYLYRLDCDGVRVVCPFTERRSHDALDVATPPGISGFTGTAELPSLQEHWQHFARERGYVTGYIGLNPLFTRPSYAEGAEPYNSIYTFDLRSDLSVLFARTHRNRQRQLRNFDEMQRRIILDRTRVAEFLLEHYPSFVERIRPAPEHRWSADTLRFLCELDSTLLIGFDGSNSIEAAHLFCYTSHAADAVLNVAPPEGRAHTSVLVWFGVRFFKQLGVPVLNMGGGAQEDNGVARAKQYFGCGRLPLRALKQIYDREVYAILCAVADVDPADSGWFPPYRRARPEARSP